MFKIYLTVRDDGSAFVSFGAIAVLFSVFASGLIVMSGVQDSLPANEHITPAQEIRCHPQAVTATMYYVETNEAGRQVHGKSTICGPIHPVPEKPESGKALRANKVRP